MEALTPDQVAAKLGKSRATVYRMFTEEYGKKFSPPQPPLPHFKVNGLMMVEPLALENWLRNQSGLPPLTEAQWRENGSRSYPEANGPQTSSAH